MGRRSKARPGSILRGQEDSRQANFLELFFDLVLVFALIGVVNRIVASLSGGSATLRWLALLHGLVLVLPMLWLWTTTAEITSRFNPRHRWIQLMTLVSAFGLLLMSASVPGAFTGRGVGYAVPYVLLQVGRPLLLLSTLRGNPALEISYSRRACGLPPQGCFGWPECWCVASTGPLCGRSPSLSIWSGRD